jgi:2,4-dienoyl-CoA reductase-like NADH-dependent reductase (Old Yellow Enzyme family)
MALFDPLELRGVTLRNRIGLSPMCMYSCDALDGVPHAFHLQHLASRAAGGCGLVITEATAVDHRGRISLADAGIWNDDQAGGWQPIAAAIADLGAVPCIQLAHAGRKAGTRVPWAERGPLPDEEFSDGVHGPQELHPVGPSAIPFAEGWRTPHELAPVELINLASAWAAAASRAVNAGFQVVELHMAHGYLLHSFLSPLTNRRTDAYGGELAGRMRFPLLVAEAVREKLPDSMPLLVRISATDWAEGGWNIEESVIFASRLKRCGVDLITCSSGGAVRQGRHAPVTYSVEPGYQVPFAERIRQETGIATAAVGLITEPRHAEQIVAGGQADVVLLGRELLRNPYWPQHAAAELGADPPWPKQYAWAVGG